MDFAKTAAVFCRYDYRDQLTFPLWQTRAILSKQVLEIVGDAAYRIGIYRERLVTVVAVVVNDEIADAVILVTRRGHLQPGDLGGRCTEMCVSYVSLLDCNTCGLPTRD
jgi:hypothetical protein